MQTHYNFQSNYILSYYFFVSNELTQHLQIFDNCTIDISSAMSRNTLKDFRHFISNELKLYSPCIL